MNELSERCKQAKNFQKNIYDMEMILVEVIFLKLELVLIAKPSKSQLS